MPGLFFRPSQTAPAHQGAFEGDEAIFLHAPLLLCVAEPCGLDLGDDGRFARADVRQDPRR